MKPTYHPSYHNAAPILAHHNQIAATATRPANASDLLAAAIGRAADPTERHWLSLSTVQRQALLQAAGLPAVKGRWGWRDLSPAERQRVAGAIRG